MLIVVVGCVHEDVLEEREWRVDLVVLGQSADVVQMNSVGVTPAARCIVASFATEVAVDVVVGINVEVVLALAELTFPLVVVLAFAAVVVVVALRRLVVVAVLLVVLLVVVLPLLSSSFVVVVLVVVVVIVVVVGFSFALSFSLALTFALLDVVDILNG